MKAFAVLGLALVSACSNAGDGAVDASPLGDSGIDAPVDADVDASAPMRVLVLNEVAAAGDPEDWIEIVNASGAPVAINEFMFVDEPGNLAKAWPFTPMTLAPGERYVQEISDALNAFKLGADEEIWIYHRADGSLSDGVDWADGDSPAGGSFARIPDTSGQFATRTRDTRGQANN